jgi:membrane protein YqaA with SNARE-associated domain
MPPPSEPADHWANLVALAWGFAEATLFFIVPDVWLTWLALRSGRTAGRACLWALAGALAGGLVMYAWGAAAAESARATVAHVPAVGQSMVEDVGKEIRDVGAWAVFIGPVTGTPYKLYAVQAGALGLSLPAFLLASAAARLGRFAAVTSLAVIANHILAGWPLAGRQALHIVLWAAFYGWYFWRFGVM